jgi:CBS domain containing-hemolysin-like protein
MVWLIIAAAALALGAGLCASAEVALMRVSRSGAGELARSRGNRNRAATRLQAVLAEPARYLAVPLRPGPSCCSPPPWSITWATAGTCSC